MSSRDQALEATLTCIANGGMKGFTVEDVARQAGSLPGDDLPLLPWRS